MSDLEDMERLGVYNIFFKKRLDIVFMVCGMLGAYAIPIF